MVKRKLLALEEDFNTVMEKIGLDYKEKTKEPEKKEIN